MAEYTNPYSYSENDTQLRSNIVKPSQNELVNSPGEIYRHKEYVDSFLDRQNISFVDRYNRARNGFLELDKLAREAIAEEYRKQNIIRKKQGRKLIDIEKTIQKKEFYMPVVIYLYEAEKNITQLSKSLDGIAVKTAVTQKIIQQSSSFSEDRRFEENKGGILGQFKKKDSGVENNGRIN